MKNKKYMLFATLIAMFALVGTAFGAAIQGDISVNINSKPFTDGTTCTSGTQVTVKFESGSKIQSGKQLKFTLENGVKLCRDIDHIISQDGTEWSMQGSTGNITASSTTSPVYTRNITELSTVGDGVVFKLRGTSGQDIIYMSILSDNADDGTWSGETDAYITVDSTDNAHLSVQCFNLTDNTDWAVPGYYVPANSTDTTYFGALDETDNAFCIDPSGGGDTIDWYYDTADGSFNFDQTSEQIANLSGETSITLVDCKDREPGNMATPATAAQGGSAECGGFDNEETGATYGWCTTGDTHANNELILNNTNGAFDQVNYQVKLQIKVNASTADGGVYFSNQAVVAGGYDTKDLACAQGDNATISGTYTYYQAGGSGASPVAPSTDCTYSDLESATTLITPITDLSLSGDNDYINIELPMFNFDNSVIESGDTVSVVVTLIQVPCGEVEIGEFEVGTFGCAASSKFLIYPYFTKDGDAFWDGFALVNLDNTSASATITVYEADGDIGTMDVTVDGYSMFVDLVSNFDLTATAASDGDGTFFNDRCFITVDSQFNCDGFAMIASGSTGESMGYLPRNQDADLSSLP